MRRSLKDIHPHAVTSQLPIESTQPISFSGRRRESAPCARLPRTLTSSPLKHASYDEDLLRDIKQTRDKASQSADCSKMTVMLEDCVSAETLECPDIPFIKRCIRVYRDSVGYGFIIRGHGPTFVTKIDPHGPAASAGIKERHYIHSVGGENVLRRGHREVARQISSDDECVDLIVMEQV